MEQPRLVIVGGPNGAGKTTLSRELVDEWGLTYLGADEVAAQLGLGSTGADAVRAGRVFVERVTQALEQRTSVLVESTLSGLGTRRLILDARAAGYDVTVVLVFVDSAETCVRRIVSRVRGGGHHVPADDVRRRFARSLRNFWERYRHDADRWQLHYNGGEALVAVARGEGDEMAVLDFRRLQHFRALLAGR